MSQYDATPCLLCHSPSRLMYHWNGYDLYFCGTCKTQFVHPMPTPEVLQTFYQQISGKKMIRWEERRRRVSDAFGVYLRYFQATTGKRKPDRFLDIGGGVGYYTYAAMERNINACLMDWADDALAFTRSRLGVLKLVEGNVQHCAAHLEANTYDYVLARHIIEHMIDPAAFVNNLRTVMTAGGLLQIETPNIMSLEQFGHPAVMWENYHILRHSNPDLAEEKVRRYAFSKSLSGVNPPKHLWGFSEIGLRHLLEPRGFEIVRVWKAPTGHPVFDPLYFEQHRLSVRKGWGIPYFFWEWAASYLFRGRGTNLVMLARQTHT